MAWELMADRPIYMQIVDTLKMRIISGAYPPGGRIPSVRELAAEAGVNPNTMQKALADLERQELISTQRTNGKTVTEDGEKIKMMRESIAQKEALSYIDKMRGLGYSAGEAQSFVREVADLANKQTTAAKYPEGQKGEDV